MSRRIEITDAAITTVAAQGMRGLTHRAVDRTAGLPEGSASYYFRTRQALLQAMVERLTELTTAEIRTVRSEDLGDLVANGAGLVEQWLTTGRDRQLARYELTLEAARRPELRQVLETASAVVRTMVADLLEAAGVAEPERRAHDFSAFLDGLLFDQIAGTGDRRLTTEDLRDAIRMLVTAVAT
jgi:DNA-binding transcriptional regulator YbjK